MKVLRGEREVGKLPDGSYYYYDDTSHRWMFNKAEETPEVILCRDSCHDSTEACVLPCDGCTKFCEPRMKRKEA